MAPDLDKLGRQLDQIRDVKNAQSAKDAQNLKDAENMGNGMRAGVELIAPIIAGGLIGWGIDQLAHTRPVGLIIMLLLGVGTGFYNVWKTTQNIGSGVGFSELHRREKDAKTLPDKEPE